MLAGLSQSMGQLIGFRALQGVGAGGLLVGAQAIIGDIVPPRERGRYMGLIGSVFAVASVAGPLLGGFFVDNLSWRWVFYVNLPVGAVALAIVVFRLHLHTPHTRHSVDYLGAAFLTGGVGSLIVVAAWGGTSSRGTRRRSSASRLPVSPCSPLPLAGARATEPIIPLELFHSRVFDVAVAMGFTVGMAMFGAIIFIPLYLRVVYGASATSAGPRDDPADGRPARRVDRVGAVISRIGCQAFPIAGTAVLTFGMFLLSRLTVDTAPWVASVYMAVVGIDRPRDAGARARRAEQRASAGHRRRHVHHRVLPLGRRGVRRRDPGRSSRRLADQLDRFPPAIRERIGTAST